MDIGAVCAGQSPPPRFVPCLLSCNNCEALMNRPKNFRVYFLLAVLAIGGIVLRLPGPPPSLLPPPLHPSPPSSTPARPPPTPPPPQAQHPPPLPPCPRPSP